MKREEAVELICRLLDAEADYRHGEYSRDTQDVRDELRHKLVDALCASEDPEVGQSLEVVRKWLDAYEFEEKAFSRYADDVILDNIMTAAERRAMSAALPKPRNG